MDTDVRLGQWTTRPTWRSGVAKDGRAAQAGVAPVGGACGISSTPGAAPGRHPALPRSAERVLDALDHRRVESLDHVEGNEVLAHLLDATRAGDHARHVRILGT